MGQKLLLCIHIRNADGRTPAWSNLLRTSAQYTHPAISYFGLSSLCAPTLSHSFFFLISSFLWAVLLHLLVPQSSVHWGVLIWLHPLLKCLNPCMQQFKPRKTLYGTLIIIFQLHISFFSRSH